MRLECVQMLLLLPGTRQAQHNDQHAPMSQQGTDTQLQSSLSVTLCLIRLALRMHVHSPIQRHALQLTQIFTSEPLSYRNGQQKV